MNRPAILTALTFVVALAWGCREGLDFDRSFTADPERGYNLYKANCATTCHPANAFEVRTVKNFEQLAYTVRDYYEQVVGGEQNYAQQDVFDMARYLNDKYYKFRVRIGSKPALDFGRQYTADIERGYHLYKGNCATTCHPDNAFEVRSVKTYSQLAYTVRDYYEQVVGDETTYAEQDIFDIARYLNEKYYKVRLR